MFIPSQMVKRCLSLDFLSESWRKPGLVPTCPCGKLGFRPPAGTLSPVRNDCGLSPIPMVVGMGRHHVVLTFVTLSFFLFLLSIQLPSFPSNVPELGRRAARAVLPSECHVSSRPASIPKLCFQIYIYSILFVLYIFVYYTYIYIYIYTL